MYIPKWIIENISTIVICMILAFIVGCILANLIHKKKNHQSSCGCGCANCPMSSKCHSKNSIKQG